MGPSGHFTHVIVILMFGIGYMQVLYLGRAPRIKETLPDFREKCRVTRHSLVFRGLTNSQRTPGFWGVTCSHGAKLLKRPIVQSVERNISNRPCSHGAK